jgi:hypothetical protein
MTTLDQLQKLYDHIREHGKLREANHRMGGIWSADHWDLNGHMAQQSDEGSTMGVGDSQGIICWSTYGRPVEYWRGRTEADLATMYQAFFPETA